MTESIALVAVSALVTLVVFDQYTLRLRGPTAKRK
jgi:hypothetical protein